MGKVSRKNKKGIKFYFLDKRSRGSTIQSIYAESKEETRRLEKLSEDIAEELMGPSAKKFMKTLHRM